MYAKIFKGSLLSRRASSSIIKPHSTLQFKSPTFIINQFRDMHAVRISSPGGPEALQYQECDKPKPTPGTVLIKNKSIGVNFIDVYHRTGVYPVPLPFTIGRDGAGVVEEIVDDPQNPINHQLKPGDRVAYFVSQGHGSYADYALASLKHIVKLPETVTYDEGAAAMVQGLTAHYLVTSSYKVNKGDAVLIHAAAGGLGQLVAQLCRNLGASIIIGTTSSEEKAKIAREAGCTHVILYTSQDFVAETKKITEGKGVQVVYDSVGKDTFEKSLDCCARRGTVVLCGNASGKVPPFDPLLLTQKGSLTLVRPSLADYIITHDEFSSRASDLFDAVSNKKLKFAISKKFPLKEAVDAHKFLEGRQSTGKIILEP